MSVEVNTEGQPITELAASCIAYSADGTARYHAKPFTRADTGGTHLNSGEGWVRFEATYDWAEYNEVVTVAPQFTSTTAGAGTGTRGSGILSWAKRPAQHSSKMTQLLLSMSELEQLPQTPGISARFDAGILNAGEIAAARIGAKAITGDKLLIGGATNLLPGGDSIADSAAGWSAFGRNTSDPSVWLRGQTTVETDAGSLSEAAPPTGQVLDVKASVEADPGSSGSYSTSTTGLAHTHSAALKSGRSTRRSNPSSLSRKAAITS